MTARFLLTSLYKKVVVKNNITPLCLCNPFLLNFYQIQIFVCIYPKRRMEIFVDYRIQLLENIKLKRKLVVVK